MSSDTQDVLVFLSIFERLAAMFSNLYNRLSAAHAEGRPLDETDLKSIEAEFNDAMGKARENLSKQKAEEAAAAAKATVLAAKGVEAAEEGEAAAAAVVLASAPPGEPAKKVAKKK